jgi:hypothetical protein
MRPPHATSLVLIALAAGCFAPKVVPGAAPGSFDAGHIDDSGLAPPPFFGLDASVVDRPGPDLQTVVSGQPGALNDASLDVQAICLPDGGPAAPGPLARRCAVETANECDGRTDINPQLPNGQYGNGFDDDCDGKVDEGCACDPGHPVGTTKGCALISASQADPVSKKPVGWCAVNSVGTLSCIETGDVEFRKAVWDGECRGAQLPFGDDICARGDFDCDGRETNSRTQDCSCKVDLSCPTDPVVETPFPDTNNLPPIDGSSWIKGGVDNARNWKWTVTGGDCDNILPHPTFAIYGQPRATAGGPRLSANQPQTGLGLNGNQNGFVVGPAPNVGPRIYPAFALSGDYLVKGEWDGVDGHHACTVKVQVRAPGIRAELCWAPMPQDVDLHFARLQNPRTCTHGWFQTCAADQNADDCYFDDTSGCLGFNANPSPWGYARSPDNACHGWGSLRQEGCDNPRLDQDNIVCDPAVADPLDQGGVGDGFCTPENINLDNPKDGDRFAVGVHFYDFDGTIDTPPRPHVNIYCNGERKLAFGFDPTSVPPTQFPVLRRAMEADVGDFWEVATVQAHVDPTGSLTDCTITPVRSKVPKPDKDGSNNICVDTDPQNGAAMGVTKWKFSPTGVPATADGLCWH